MLLLCPSKIDVQALWFMCSLEISSKEMNIGAERLAATLAKFAKQGKEVNIWRQFGDDPALLSSILWHQEDTCDKLCWPCCVRSYN